MDAAAYAARGIGDASVDMVALLLDAGGAVMSLWTTLHSPWQFVVSRKASDPSGISIVGESCACSCAPAPPLSQLTIDQVANPSTNTRTFATQEHFSLDQTIDPRRGRRRQPASVQDASRKQILLLRSLALKGRAEPRDARMTFLVEPQRDRLEGRLLDTGAHGARLARGV